MAKRLDIENCVGIVIDVQEYFLKSLPKDERRRIEPRIADFVALLGYLAVPVLCTVERPLDLKGRVPEVIERELSRGSKIYEKDFFDLTGERPIVQHLKSFGRKQMILAGCETDVCVLHSCLGLLARGYEVYIVEDLLFSSCTNTRSALERMRGEGAIVLTFKTLYYELVRSVRGSKSRAVLEKTHGKLPARFHDL